MSERISAGAIPPGKRVSAADLTPMERDKLTTEGRVGPDGFVDIAEPEKPQVIDMKAAARQKAAKDLTAAISGPPVAQDLNELLSGPKAVLGVPAAAVGASAARGEDALRKELIRLQEKMATREKCPRCGLHFEEPYGHEATPEDIKDFLKCVLSATAFVKAYQLFGGRLMVTLGTRSGAIAELIRKAVTAQVKRGEISNEDEVIRSLRQFTMAATLQAYAADGKNLQYSELPTDSVEAFAKAAQERIDAVPEPIQLFLRPVLGEFNMLVDLLTSRAQDPNFWTGTAK